MNMSAWQVEIIDPLLDDGAFDPIQKLVECNGAAPLEPEVAPLPVVDHPPRDPRHVRGDFDAPIPRVGVEEFALSYAGLEPPYALENRAVWT
jgi:hypothetical protein